MIKSFSTLCADLAHAHREWHLAPTDLNEAKALAAYDALVERCDVTWTRKRLLNGISDDMFIAICNRQLRAYQAYRDRPDKSTERELRLAIGAVREALKPPRA